MGMPTLSKPCQIPKVIFDGIPAPNRPRLLSIGFETYLLSDLENRLGNGGEESSANWRGAPPRLPRGNDLRSKNATVRAENHEIEFGNCELEVQARDQVSC